jgi:hypothetical protein
MAALLGSALLLVGCSLAADGPPLATPAPGPSPCRDGSRRCAAAAAMSGSRSLRRGHRIHRYRWIPKINRESGEADVGLQADWQPTWQRE